MVIPLVIFQIYTFFPRHNRLVPAKIKENRPDLVCPDILMPEKSGIGLYRELRKDEGLKGIPRAHCNRF